MAGIDQLVNDRVDTYSGNEQALQQRYAQNQDLMDLLALQKLKSQQEAAGREMQMQAQNNPDTIKQQMEAEMVKRNKDELLQRVGPTMQRQAAQEQKQMQEAPQRAQQAPQGLASLQQQMQQQPQQFNDGGQVSNSRKAYLERQVAQEAADSRAIATDIENYNLMGPKGLNPMDIAKIQDPEERLLAIYKYNAENPDNVISEEDVDNMAVLRSGPEKAAELVQYAKANGMSLDETLTKARKLAPQASKGGIETFLIDAWGPEEAGTSRSGPAGPSFATPEAMFAETQTGPQQTAPEEVMQQQAQTAGTQQPEYNFGNFLEDLQLSGPQQQQAQTANAAPDGPTGGTQPNFATPEAMFAETQVNPQQTTSNANVGQGTVLANAPQPYDLEGAMAELLGASQQVDTRQRTAITDPITARAQQALAASGGKKPRPALITELINRGNASPETVAKIRSYGFDVPNNVAKARADMFLREIEGMSPSKVDNTGTTTNTSIASAGQEGPPADTVNTTSIASAGQEGPPIEQAPLTGVATAAKPETGASNTNAGIATAVAPAVAPITTKDLQYKGADYSGIAGNVQGFLGGFGLGSGQLPDAEKQRAIGEKRAEKMTGRKEKTASMQKLIDRYEKVLNEQQDAGKSKREQINAFLRGGAGQSSMGMALASGSSSLAQTRENQEAQVRTGVRELIKANRDLAVFDSEMAKTTLENGMTYFQEAKNDSRAAAEMASRMTNQQMQNANIQAQQEYNAMSDNEKRRLDAEIANGNMLIRRTELAFAQKSQTKQDRLMQYATLARQAGAINSERADRIQSILEKDLEYKAAVVQFQGASAELQKAINKGESAEKQAKIKQDIATARFDMDRRGDSANLNALNIQNVSGQLALQSRVMVAMDTIFPEANPEILTDKASDRGVMQGLSRDSSTFLERSRTESLGGL